MQAPDLMDGEKLKPVKGYEGLYSISNMGRVYAHKKKIRGSNQFGARFSTTVPARWLKLQRGEHGYLHFTPRKGGKQKTVLVHRALMIAFVGVDSVKTDVNHINGVKTDNRLINLEWVTKSENIRHAFNTGLYRLTDRGRERLKKSGARLGKSNIGRRFYTVDVDEASEAIEAHFNSGAPLSVIAKHSTVSLSSLHVFKREAL